MENPPSIVVAPIPAPIAMEFTKLTFGTLYIRRGGPNCEISMDGVSNLGKRYFSDFPIYDGPGSEAKLVARMQGVTTQTGTFHQIFTIVFVMERFMGSTLLTNGVITGGSDEWAVYGGTGVFAMANGLVRRKYVADRNDGNTDEFTMEVFVQGSVTTLHHLLSSAMENPLSIVVAPIPAPISMDFIKLTFGTLYIRRGGPNCEISMDGVSNLGKQYFSDFPIYDGPGSEAMLVARMQGVTTQTGAFHQIFTIVFEIERFKGSTLLTNGVITGGSDEWAVYGGTGVFAMASGLVRRKYVADRNDGNTDEFTMEFFVPVMRGSLEDNQPHGSMTTLHHLLSTAMENPPSIVGAPIPAPIAMELTKLTFGTLNIRGEGSNCVISMDGVANLGKRFFCDFPIYDGPGSEAKLVARMQGVATQTCRLHQIFTIVFEIERFKGSTLLTNGLITDGSDEWAVYSGTGVFAMASGVIKRKYVGYRNDGNTDEFTMEVFVPVMRGSLEDSQQKGSVTKVGLWGGKGGLSEDITAQLKRLQTVTIRSGDAIDSIEFIYIDESGQEHTAGPWGGPGGVPHTIDLDGSEYIKEISGTYGIFQGVPVLTSFKLVTNFRAWGPWAMENGTPFTFTVPTNTSVVGFYGSGGTFLDAIGVYLHQL